MTATSYTHLTKLLANPDSSGPDLLAAARELRESFVRSEHLIGLLPGDAPQVMVAGFERAANAGEVQAWENLGMVYQYGAAPWAPYPTPDVAAAIRAYQRGDALGDRSSALGWIRAAYFARSLEHATAASARVDELLAESPGDGGLLLLRGYFAHQGFGVPQDAAAAARWHHQAAEAGDADAAFELSVLYAAGDGVGEDAAESDRWTRRAAELGSPRAMANLGGMYATGRGVALDARVALDWYAKAADLGHMRAAFTAGVMCLTGDGGLPVDEQRASAFFSLADELGFDVDGTHDALGIARPNG
ncbi:tetratricopeptide repeat protein [Stackebrandtia soli]|uniref:tetratricopeptide repeat protein n=1 Tax=Stackebrandtia soli TaxID=1892856 RepID=UPI0039E9B8A4